MFHRLTVSDLIHYFIKQFVANDFNTDPHDPIQRKKLTLP